MYLSSLPSLMQTLPHGDEGADKITHHFLKVVEDCESRAKELAATYTNNQSRSKEPTLLGRVIRGLQENASCSESSSVQDNESDTALNAPNRKTDTTAAPICGFPTPSDTSSGYVSEPSRARRKRPATEQLPRRLIPIAPRSDQCVIDSAGPINNTDHQGAMQLDAIPSIAEPMNPKDHQGMSPLVFQEIQALDSGPFIFTAGTNLFGAPDVAPSSGTRDEDGPTIISSETQGESIGGGGDVAEPMFPDFVIDWGANDTNWSNNEADAEDDGTSG